MTRKDSLSIRKAEPESQYLLEETSPLKKTVRRDYRLRNRDNKRGKGPERKIEEKDINKNILDASIDNLMRLLFRKRLKKGHDIFCKYIIQ